MKCLLIINTSCGNIQRVLENSNFHKEIRANFDEVSEFRITEEDKDSFDLCDKCKGYDALVICGGDGTFNSALNATKSMDIDLIYVPCGTLNDAAHTMKSIAKESSVNLRDRRLRHIDLGEINGLLFSYVAACGSFTSIGYHVKSKTKKLFKRFIYYVHAFKEYKVHNIKSKIIIDNEIIEGDYTLIMAVKSKFVFGLPFNKLYKHDSGSGHLLLIKAPTGIFKYIKMFFLFFRAFFIGFKKEINTKNILFKEFTSASIELDSPQNFCIDGERFLIGGNNEIRFHKKIVKIFVP
ncbi:MAG: hypothetical protein LBF68_01205 [Christensenellaceae bacterium]|jgi:diacylglycerol kinase family enzyme|nr:hypothetical protein [Christensenellaceae bacterium]